MIEQELIAALKAKDFDAAYSWSILLGEQIKLELKQAPDRETRTAIYRRSIATLTDSLHLARVIRAHLSSQLNANTGIFLYQQSELEQHRWRIQA